MVPCQPRQLVIFSLPFAALVAFFWFKRRKSSSRSDPGGTSGQLKPVDDPASPKQPEAATIQFVDKIIASKSVCTLPTKFEEITVKRVETIADQNLKTAEEVKEIVTTVNKNSIESIPSEKVTIVKTEKEFCNGAAFCTITELEFENIVPCKLGLSTPDFETSKVLFYPTTIEDGGKDDPILTTEQSLLKEVDIDEFIDQICTEAVQKVDVRRAEKITKDKLQKKQSADVTVPFEEQSTVQNLTPSKQAFKESADKSILNKDQNTGGNILLEQGSEEEIALEYQSTKENITLKNNFNESLDKSLFPEVSSVDEIKGRLSLKSTCSSESTESIENTSVDTGVGTSTEEEFVMAQEHTSEEKTESETTVLEQKLTSLGLDTQQPLTNHRAERDSANHSPAEVMLNSPAISTFSDAHSEGSSDSGKGCSDVATPPSRTPAGGSSVAGDQVPSIYEFVLPQVIVGRLIGRHGAFLHDIRTKTHTNVFIKRHPETNTLKICAIEGSQQDIDAALKMIRQKFPLRRFPDLTLERVTFVKNSTFPISPENLQLQLVEGLNNDVLVSSVISAGNLFLQLPMHLSYQSLYRMACIMTTVYTTEESPPLQDPRPDVVCVAPSHGGWYRVQIISVDEETNSSIIRFLDYGGYTTVDNSALRQIRGDFLLLPFQAVECALAKVVPAGGEPEWSEEAKQFVQMMTTQQVLQAQVCEYTESGLPLVYLYCTQFYQSPTDPSGYETKVVLLNDELVANDFADLIKEDEEAEDEGKERTATTESS